MGRRVYPQSIDPAAAVWEALEQINYSDEEPEPKPEPGAHPEPETVEAVFNVVIDDGSYKDLVVEVKPGTPHREVMRALRHAAHQPR
ncbi:hypothetical protein [Actinomadura sp. NPDC049753]|uniref:hypothetical protein n=1 Tax=Actinomadura sp. NPDC049753 TaxID=3154739 RepID=UPI003426202C